jgi:hypothetical protein
MTPSGESPSGRRGAMAVDDHTRVCPRCGVPAGEAEYCQTCGLHLWRERELPTSVEWQGSTRSRSSRRSRSSTDWWRQASPRARAVVILFAVGGVAAFGLAVANSERETTGPVARQPPRQLTGDFSINNPENQAAYVSGYIMGQDPTLGGTTGNLKVATANCSPGPSHLFFCQVTTIVRGRPPTPGPPGYADAYFDPRVDDRRVLAEFDGVVDPAGACGVSPRVCLSQLGAP